MDCGQDTLYQTATQAPINKTSYRLICMIFKKQISPRINAV
jgi:hypothetical protein